MTPIEVPRLARNRVAVFGLVALLCCIWGSTWFVIREGLRDLPPFTAATARFTTAAVVMALVAPRLARIEGGSRPGWGLALLAGFGQFSLSYGIVYWTEQYLPSGLVSVLWAVFPLMLAGLAWLLLPDERLSGRQWLGMVLGFSGIVILFSTDVQAQGDGSVGAGLVLLLSPLVCAVSTIHLKRAASGVSSALLNRDAMTVGAIGLALAALVAERDVAVSWTPTAVASVAYLALVGTCLAFGVYLWLLRWVPAYRLSLIAYVSPMFALLLGVFLGNEPLGQDTVVGSACILVGVCVAGMAGRRRSDGGSTAAS